MANLSVGRRACHYAFGASALAIAAFSSTAVSAQCIPNPPANGQTTKCDGEQVGGLVVPLDNGTVEISDGAVLSSSTAAALLVARQSSATPMNTTNVVANGAIRGIGQYGIEFRTGAPNASFGTYETLKLTIGAGGSVTGTTGIAMTSSAANPYGSTNLTLDNSGAIGGTGGYAIRTAPNVEAHLSVVNQESGVIGAISGVFYGLDNKGTINGDQNSAIDGRVSGIGPSATLQNSGTITSSGAAATITGLSYNYTLTNSGTIANTGSGVAIDGNSVLLTNAAGGVIRAGADGVAIRTGDGALQLVNSGTIDGDVLIRTPASNYVASSSVDSTGGTINGDLTFGAGSDTLHAVMKDGALFTGVTGAVNGGEGNDGILLDIGKDTTITTGISVAGFEYLNIKTGPDTTTTLADGFTWAGPLSLTGSGTAINQTHLIANGYLGLQAGDAYGYGLKFTNLGTITGTANSEANVFRSAILLYNTAFDNSGTIDIIGDALTVSGGSFTNSGTITATNNTVYNWGPFANNGTIRSTAGTALTMDTSAYGDMKNSGVIDGAKVGIRLGGGTFLNSGLISSAAAAVAASGTLYNQAGGTIRGGTLAIGPSPGSTVVAGATVFNAGVIDGDVYLASSSSYAGVGNRFIALKGGVLNGSLTLSQSDMLVTDLSSRTDSGFTGINGTVSANGAALRYQVTSDTTATLGAIGGFGSVSYEVAEGTTLTLNAAVTQTASLTLAGHGTVDLGADFTLADKPAITLVAPIQLPGESQVNSDLMVVSRGNISVRLQNPVTYPEYGAAVYLGTSGYLGTVGQFTNKGTISYQNAWPATNGIAAIRGDGKVVNDGTILLDRAIAISGATEVINNGSIIEAPGGSASQGISATNITNTGVVRVSNQAISVDSYATTIRNSGTLESLTTTAIAGYSARIQNDASGVIRGTGAAIQLQGGGSVINSGSIIGTVDLGYSPYGGRSSYSGIYVADGGTLQGGLLFGDGDDLFYAKDGMTGVSGTIDGGAGRNVFAIGYDGAATAAVDRPITEASKFEDRLSVASGESTTLTLVAGTTLASAVNIAGDGWIVNRVPTTSMISDYVASRFTPIVPTMLAGFTNEADIQGVSIHARNFVNNGNIGASGASIYTTDYLNFTNSGSIVGAFPESPVVNLSASNLSTLSATNEATIDGGLAVGARFSSTAASPAVNVVNKGMIRATDTAAIDIGISTGNGKGAISIDNQGVVDGGVAGISIQDFNTYGSIIPTPIASAITSISLTNSGTIRTTGDGARVNGVDGQGNIVSFVTPAITIRSLATTNLALNNKAGGLIAATGQASIAIISNGALTLINDGTIQGIDRIEGGTRLAGAIVTGDADDYVRNNSTITGSIHLGNGNNRVENHGTIDGDVSFGVGNDSYVQSKDAILTGTVDGGAGFNTLVIDLDGDGAFTPPRYRNFQGLEQIGGGTVEYTAPVTFDSFTVSNGVFRVAQNNAINSLGTFTITGGRVVGALGSTMTATRFDVGKGATFGSAGTVNGDINVQGILSPGASPGTMTINGTLSLASGSTTLFEMTPTISDAIIINGKLIIANGATLTLTGSRPLTPGSTYDLITARDGISGRFTTIDKAATVLGLILQTADSIELLGQFVLPEGANPQAARVTEYLNKTLMDASAAPVILAASAPLLDGTGFANAMSMRRLSPEAYASATQIGVEQGLALVSASRTFAMAEDSGEARPFTFGQMFGAWRDLPGQSSVGTARADVSTHGLVGGVGYGSQHASIGAFIGWATASQHIRELGTTTDMDGIIAGVTGIARLGNLAVTALIARNGDKADTTRLLPGDGGKARGRYDLNSWVYDIHLSYDLKMSSDWTLSPELSGTRIAAHRASALEKVGATPFGLLVNASKLNATFISAALKLTGNPNRALQPWLSGGFRSQLSGRTPTATAGFANVSSGSMLAYGAGRSRALATIAGGLNIRVSRSAELLAHAGSEFGADSTGQEAGLGLRMRF